MSSRVVGRVTKMTREELKKTLFEDREANDYRLSLKNIFNRRGKVMRLLKALRHLEYHDSKNHRLLSFFWKTVFWRRENRLFIELHPHCFGPGLRIEHPVGIIVNANAKIGKNCNIHQFVTIGNNGKVDTAAEIGDNCYIGANTVILGAIKVGNNVTIGAGSIVTKNIPDNAVVAGVPARVLRIKDNQ